MRILRRLLGWVTFLGFLTAVGVVVFFEVRYRPRCTIVGEHRFLQISADGGTVVTATVLRNEIPGNEAVRIGAPVQVWDTQSGQVRFTLLENAGYVDLWDAALSPDQRHIAVASSDGVIHVLDCDNGVEHTLDLGEHAQCGFSPGGAWMLVRTTKNTPTDFVVEVATRRVVLRPPRDDMDSRDFNPDDKTALLRETGKPGIAVWDLAAGKKIGVLPTAKGPWTEISRDGRYFLNNRLAGEAPADPGPLSPSPEVDDRLLRDEDRLVEIWDVTALCKRYNYMYRHRYFMTAKLAASGRHAMIYTPLNKGYRADVVEINKGRKVLTLEMESSYHEFSVDGNLLCLSHSKKRTAMIDLASGQTLWEKPMHGAVQFVGTTGVLLYLDEKVATKPSELLDVRTGERRAVVPLLSKDPSAAGRGLDAGLPRPTPDGQRLLVVGLRHAPRSFWEAWLARWWPARFGENVPGMVVMETSTGRVLFQVFTPVGDLQFLSHDGAALTTVTESSDRRSTLIRVWDAGSQRAWTWALAVSAGTGLGLWVLRRAVRWLRTARTKAA
jgi:WD40 repeat protein